jgi:hypothetical protein
MDNRLKDDELKKVVGGTGENEEDEEDKCPNSPDGKHSWVKSGVLVRGMENNYCCFYCKKPKT